jgi:hypothetical protein
VLQLIAEPGAVYEKATPAAALSLDRSTSFSDPFPNQLLLFDF